MRENIVNFLNNEVFVIKDDKEKINKSLNYFSNLSEENKRLFLEIIINVKEKKLGAPSFDSDMFFKELEKSNVNYDFEHILNYISDDDSAFSNENIILILMNNREKSNLFFNNIKNNENLFNILLTMFINDKNILNYKINKKFDFSPKYLNNPHLEKRLEQNKMNGKKDINELIDNFFEEPSHTTNIFFVVRKKSLNKILIKNPNIKNYIINSLADSDFKHIDYFCDSVDFLKEIENIYKSNTYKHSHFLNEILHYSNNENELNEFYINEFIIKNKDIINNDYLTNGEYTRLYPNYYKNEENYKILLEKIDIIKKESLDMSNLLSAIINKNNDIKKTSKDLKEYIKKPEFKINNMKNMFFSGDKKILIESPLCSLIGDNSRMATYMIDNISLFKILFKAGEIPDLKLDNEFPILNKLNTNIQYRVLSSDAKTKKRIISIINNFIVYSDVNNIFEQKELLKTRNKYIINIIKNNKNINIVDMFLPDLLMKNKSNFINFCMESLVEIKEDKELEIFTDFLKENIEKIIENSNQEELKKILSSIKNNENKDNFKNLLPKIENKILIKELIDDSRKDCKNKKRL